MMAAPAKPAPVVDGAAARGGYRVPVQRSMPIMATIVRPSPRLSVRVRRAANRAERLSGRDRARALRLAARAIRAAERFAWEVR